MEYKEYRPHPLLSNYVECYWSAYSVQPPFRAQESLIPDGTIEMMFNFGDDYFQIREGRKIKVEGSHIIGIRGQSLIISQTHHQHVFSIRFKLGGTYSFFKVPSYLFANTFSGIGDLLGNEYLEMEERLYEASSNEERVQIANQLLLKKLNPSLFEYHFVNACTNELLSSPMLRINGLVKKFNTNYKTIERRFKNVTGITPEELLKVKRFNNAILSMYSCKHNSLTDVSYECGYYDQSHFIREFKQLSGFTPKAFLKEQFTIVQVIQPALAQRLSKSYNL